MTEKEWAAFESVMAKKPSDDKRLTRFEGGRLFHELPKKRQLEIIKAQAYKVAEKRRKKMKSARAAFKRKARPPFED